MINYRMAQFLIVFTLIYFTVDLFSMKNHRVYPMAIQKFKEKTRTKIIKLGGNPNDLDKIDVDLEQTASE
jgi:hypothetical protein